jgi:eukaryotic-like serine/threonine-protein kinase
VLIKGRMGTKLFMPQTIVDNRYTRSKPLGSGGMAEVYLAHDEVLDRDVAIKVLKEQHAGNEEFVRLFRREARSAARLNHSNIVSVYDQGRSEDGTDYIAMEYVSGGTLKDRVLGEGAVDSHGATEVAIQIAQALGHAHEHGVIHRDIKSRNILLTQAGYAKVADFGIARAATATTTGSRSHPILGTPGYLSPEQAMGQPVDPRSDLYSLGVVLYEMLTGTLPYSGEDPASMAFQHVHGPLRSPREANPDIPEPLNALTTKLLAKDPEERYASAAELVDDLERVRSGLSPLNVGTEKTATKMITTPLLSSREQQGQTTTIRQYVAAPIMEVFTSGVRGRGRLVRTLAMALGAVLLLGGLAWALMQDQSIPETPGSEEASSAEGIASPSIVQVPELYYASEAEGTLADAGLEIGNRNEASDDTVPAGVVIEQDPEAGTTVEEDTAVDIVVSTGPEQAPAAIQGAPSSVSDAAGSQGGLAAQPAASNAAGLKQVPAAVQGTPASIDAATGSRQEAPAPQSAEPSATGQTQAPAVVQAAPQAVPFGVDVGSRQEAPTPRAASAPIQSASGPSVSDKTEQKEKKITKELAPKG